MRPEVKEKINNILSQLKEICVDYDIPCISAYCMDCKDQGFSAFATVKETVYTDITLDEGRQ